MTAPRQILAGSTYLVTRRCSERRFFLKPSTGTNAIFLYVLAVMAERYQIQVHAYCVLSNHFHLVVTDPHARLPEFHRDLDGLVARAANRGLGRRERFWAPDSYSAVRLEDEATVLAKMVYVLANPVAAGLVPNGDRWPGLWSDPSLIGGAPVEVARPEAFFRESGVLPATARLQLRSPPGHESDAALGETLRHLLREAEARAAARLEEEGRSFLGVARVLAEPFTASPSRVEPRRTLVPRVAARNAWRRLEALKRLAEFQGAYREAFEGWRAGLREVLFPVGTWHLRVLHAARCASG